MREFQDKVAVITGAASGIGRAIAFKCILERMKVVLADYEADALTRTESDLKKSGGDVLAVPTDVSKIEDVRELARRAIDGYGAVHLLFNNAGVAVGGTIWESDLADWEWLLGVNLWGVIYGLRVFIPLMLKQDTEGHIINTSSLAGLISLPGWGAYQATKHAVVSLSETLHHELAERESKLRVSVLCPAFVKTRIFDSTRNRPARFVPDDAGEMAGPEKEACREALRERVEAGITPEEVAEMTFAAIRDEKFYVLTHPQSARAVERRLEDLMKQREPANPFIKQPDGPIDPPPNCDSE